MVRIGVLGQKDSLLDLLNVSSSPLFQCGSVVHDLSICSRFSYYDLSFRIGFLVMIIAWKHRRTEMKGAKAGPASHFLSGGSGG